MVEALQVQSKLHIGSSLQYRIESILGRGGFGITYLATDLNLDMLVAIKEYLPSDFAERTSSSQVAPKTGDDGDLYQWGLDRFIEEARILARFKHPNIVRVLNVFKKNNTAYMIMEYEEGSNLQELLKVASFRSEERLTNIFDAILGGLEQVHEHSIVHRDIKPANIYIRKDYSPVLLDFGSARKHLSDKSQVMTRILTKGYAPYEQEVEGGGRQGPWTDIYSIGVTLYYAISQKLPTNSISRFTRVIQAQSDPLIPARELECASQYSYAFLNAIDQALQVKPEDRPQSAADFRRILKPEMEPPEISEPSINNLSQDKTVLESNNFYEQTSQRDCSALQSRNDIEKTELVVEKKLEPPPPAQNSGVSTSLIVALIIAGGSSAWWFLKQEAPVAHLPESTVEQQVNDSSPTPEQEIIIENIAENETTQVSENVLDLENKRLQELQQIEQENKKQLRLRQQELEAFEAEQKKRAIEVEKMAEAQRLAEAKKAAETQRLVEAEKAAVMQRLAEAEKAAEIQRLAEAEKAAEVQRLVKAEKAAEIQRLAEAEKAAEMQRLAEAEKAVEMQRLAEAEKAVEMQRLAEAEKTEAKLRRQKEKKQPIAATSSISTEEINRQKTENDMQTISRLFNDFRIQLKTCDIKALTKMSKGHKDNVSFIKQLCKQYSSMTLGIKDLRGNAVQGTASANIEIKSLLNQNGDHIYPSKSWNTLPLKSNKTKEYWGQVEW